MKEKVFVGIVEKVRNICLGDLKEGKGQIACLGIVIACLSEKSIGVRMGRKRRCPSPTEC